jgi:BRCT domain type II-containing protein
MQYGTWRRILVVVAGLAAGYACSQTPSDSAPGPKDLSSRQTQVPGEYLVTLAPGADVAAIGELYGRFGIKGTRDIGQNVFVVTLTEDPGPAKLEELRSQNAKIKAVQPNFIYRSSGRGNVQ